MLRSLSFLLLATLATSCAYHVGNVSTGSHIDCPMRYIATGSSKSYKVLGIGGINKEALIMEAKQDLYQKFPYQKDVKLSNFSVDFQYLFVLVYFRTKVTVSADVFDCSTDKLGTKDFRPEDRNMAIGGFVKGDSLLYEFEGYHKGTFVKYAGNGKFEIEYRAESGKTKTTVADPDLIFKTSKDTYNVNYYGFDVGETANVTVKNSKTNTKTMKPCTIIGLNSKYAIVSYVKDSGETSISTVRKSVLKK